MSQASQTAIRRSIEDFEAHCRWVENATDLSLMESTDMVNKRIARAQKDFAFFVQQYFPHYATAKSAPFHIEASRVLLKYPILRMMLIWYRGGSKSIHADLLYPMWLKIQKQRELDAMVLVGKSGDNAVTLISDIQAELEYNQRFIHDFGEQKLQGAWEEGEFRTKDGVAFYALGRGQSPRGLRNKATRPNYYSIDDIDDDELVRNEARVDQVMEWIERALILSSDLGAARVLYANNLIHERSVTAKLMHKYVEIQKHLKQLGINLTDPANTHYHISKVPIKNAQGVIAWPERVTEQRVMELELELGYAASQTELYHNPVSQGKKFKKEWMQFKSLPPVNSCTNLVVYLDGGFKNTSTSDSKCLVCLGINKGEIHVYKVYCGKASRLEQVGWAYDLDRWLKEKNAAAVWYMEEVFLLDLLYQDFAEAAKPVNYGYHIPLQGDKRKKPDKDLRIESLTGYFERGQWFFNQAEESSHHMKNLLAQFMAFEPPKKTLKDGPDACEGAVYKAKERITTSGPQSYGQRSRSTYKFKY